MAIAPANVCEYYYTPGQEISGIVTTTAVVGKTFVKVNANRAAGPALNTSAAGGNVAIGPASAAGAPLGVARWDGAVGAIVPVVTAGVVPVTAGGTIAAGAEVEIDSSQRAVAYSSGIKVGYCLSGATVGNDAQIKLY
jgi:hypothetical protein